MTTNQATTLAQRSRRPRGQQPKPRRGVEEKAAEQFPEHLEAHEIDALIKSAPNPRAWQGKGSKARIVPFYAELRRTLTSTLQCCTDP